MHRRHSARRPGHDRGQALVLFVMAIFVFTGIIALVVDVSWYWATSLRIQRAADAAALAGVVYLPGDVPKAATAAQAEAARNGYQNGGAVVVTPAQDATNPRRMKVTVSAPVGTFFMRIFGINSIPASRKASAEYVLPVPMGSPQNYYGVYGYLRTPSNPNPGPTNQMSLSSGPVPANQGFWGTMISQGATKTNGDAFLAKYNYPPGSTNTNLNTEYNPAGFYDYGIEMAPGSTGGSVWIFDPVFCATNGNGAYGTGDRWFGGTAATSAFYDLYDTNGSPYDLTDDILVASSGTFFRRVQAADRTLFSPSSSAPSVPTCTQGAAGITPADPRYWHNRWYQLPLVSGQTISGGVDALGNPIAKLYRLRTSSTDPASPNDQDAANGHNSFSIEARAGTGNLPRVYGLGSMEAYSPLPQGLASTFFFAQIDAVNAGKTVQIELWDPGDTGNLSATLEILEPTTTGWSPARFSYTARLSGAGGSSCNSRTGTNVGSVVTNTGGTSLFNGCWLTISVPLPASYSAPIPPAAAWPAGIPTSAQGPGWWRIRYTMGSGSGSAFDVTTWRVSIRGNPVHLIVP